MDNLDLIFSFSFSLSIIFCVSPSTLLVCVSPCFQLTVCPPRLHDTVCPQDVGPLCIPAGPVCIPDPLCIHQSAQTVHALQALHLHLQRLHAGVYFMKFIIHKSNFYQLPERGEGGVACLVSVCNTILTLWGEIVVKLGCMLHVVYRIKISCLTLVACLSNKLSCLGEKNFTT